MLAGSVEVVVCRTRGGGSERVPEAQRWDEAGAAVCSLAACDGLVNLCRAFPRLRDHSNLRLRTIGKRQKRQDARQSLVWLVKTRFRLLARVVEAKIFTGESSNVIIPCLHTSVSEGGRIAETFTSLLAWAYDCQDRQDPSWLPVMTIDNSRLNARPAMSFHSDRELFSRMSIGRQRTPYSCISMTFSTLM